MAEIADSHLIAASWADVPGLGQLSSGAHGNTVAPKHKRTEMGKEGEGVLGGYRNVSAGMKGQWQPPADVGGTQRLWF